MLMEDDRMSTDEAFTKGLVLEIQRVDADNKALRTQLAQQAEMVEKCVVEMNANADAGEKAQDEINCAEAALEALTCEFTDSTIESKFNDGFDCLGDYISALHDVIKTERERKDAAIRAALDAMQYHVSQTRPIHKTLEAIEHLKKALQ